MQKRYRSAPIDERQVAQMPALILMAAFDFDAIVQAKAHFGPEVPFTLWEGERHVLTYRSMKNLRWRKEPR